MILHLFILRWKPAASAAEKARALDELLAFRGKVPGLLEVHAGVNFSLRSNGHEFGCVMKFTDRAALDAYAVSAVHQHLLDWFAPLIEPTDVDFVAAD